MIRSQSPPDPTGVPICGCYAQSTINSLLFDECEGSTDCITAKCQGDACTSYEAYCDVNQDGRGLCNLRDIAPNVTQQLEPEMIGTSNNEYIWDGKCNTSEDCYPKMRESTPGTSDLIGVSTCECYANSKIDPLDECQGDLACAIALCTEDACTGKSAFCSDEGTCQLDGEVLIASVNGGGDVVDLNPCPSGQCLSPDGVCEMEVSCFVDPCEINNGGCEGDCEANYCGGCNAVCIDSMTATTPTNNDTVNVRPSDPTPVTQAPVDYKWEGPRCSTDDDCYTKVRERVPGESEVIGVTTCQCYANSFINPLDECQGETDMTCPIAGCMENPCLDYKAFCLVESGFCYLDDSIDFPPAVTMPTVTSEGSVDLNAPTNISSSATAITAPADTIGINYTWSPICSTDDDCHPSMRTDEPGETEPFGVSICQCYANSFSAPFDECQGDVICISAMCLEFACEGKTAYCSDEGICELSAAGTDTGAYNTSNTIATVVTTASSSSSTTTISAPAIVIDETASNETAQGLTNATKPASGGTADNIKPDNNDITTIDETAPTNESEATDGTSSSVVPSTPSDPDVIAIDETSTSSTIPGDTSEIEVSGSTSENIQGNPVKNETSEEVQLESSTTSTTTFEEINANATTDDAFSTTSTTTTPDILVAVSENNQSETAPSEVDKSQEGLPLNSGIAVRSIMAPLSLVLHGIYLLMH